MVEVCVVIVELDATTVSVCVGLVRVGNGTELAEAVLVSTITTVLTAQDVTTVVLVTRYEESVAVVVIDVANEVERLPSEVVIVGTGVSTWVV